MNGNEIWVGFAITIVLNILFGARWTSKIETRQESNRELFEAAIESSKAQFITCFDGVKSQVEDIKNELTRVRDGRRATDELSQKFMVSQTTDIATMKADISEIKGRLSHVEDKDRRTFRRR